MARDLKSQIKELIGLEWLMVGHNIGHIRAVEAVLLWCCEDLFSLVLLLGWNIDIHDIMTLHDIPLGTRTCSIIVLQYTCT